MSNNILVVYTFIILLPLIPAVLLFKVLRSSATVDGPVAGMKVSLGGSFGGYFVLFMVLVIHFKELPQVEKWHVRGSFQVADGDAVPEIKIVPQPPEISINSRQFDIDVPHVKGLPPPLLLFDAKGYPAQTVDLAEVAASPTPRDGYAKWMHLGEIKFVKNQAVHTVEARPIGGTQ
jgi:hypothetical protein